MCYFEALFKEVREAIIATWDNSRLISTIFHQKFYRWIPLFFFFSVMIRMINQSSEGTEGEFCLLFGHFSGDLLTQRDLCVSISDMLHKSCRVLA